jgi:hypothetical protein
VVWELGDHRTVNGIRFAHQIVMRMDGAVFRRIQVQEVKLDPEVPADFFNPGSR